MIRFFLLLLLFPLLLSACAKPVELGGGFEKLSGHFVQAVRWQDFRGASMFLAAEEREAFLEQFPRNKDLHMVDVHYEQVTLNEEDGEAESVLFVEYYLLPSATLKEWRWTQQWRRQQGGYSQDTLWLIQAPPPAFP